MRGRLAVIATALMLVVAFATPASAITNGKPDSALCRPGWDHQSHGGIAV